MLKKIILSALIAVLAVGSVSGLALAAAPESEGARKNPRFLYGEVISVDEEGFQVMSQQGEEISFRVNGGTRYRNGSFADIQPGVKVAVASRGEGHVAKVVAILPPDFEPGGNFAIRARGEVTAVDPGAGKFRIQEPDGKALTFFVDEKTRYGGQLEDLSDMQVGWKAAVAARETEEGKTVATLVIAGERPELNKMRGKVTSVDSQAGKFRIETRESEIVTFFVDENTRYGGQLEDLSEMQVGWAAGVGAKEGEDGRWIAAVVFAGERPELNKMRGKVTAVDSQAGKFRIETREGEIVTFFVDENTRYRGQLEDLSEMQVGWAAGVGAKEGEDGQWFAAVVFAGEPRDFIKARGEITALDEGLGKIRLEKKDGTVLTFFVDESTQFRGQAQGFEDLRVGWTAGIAAMEGEDGKLIARLVIAGEARAESPPLGIWGPPPVVQPEA
jgi:hypothetical protein